MLPELEHEWFRVCVEKHGCEEEIDAWDAFKIACEIESYHRLVMLEGKPGNVSFYDPRFQSMNFGHRTLYSRACQVGDTLIYQEDTWDFVLIRIGKQLDNRGAIFTTGYHFIPQESCELQLIDLADYEVAAEAEMMPNFYISRWKWLVMRAWWNSVERYNEILKTLGGDTGEV